LLPVSDPDLIVRKTAYVNIAFVAICSIVFLYELLIGTMGKFVLFYQYGLLPSEIVTGNSLQILDTGIASYKIETPFSDLITFITSMFLHGDFVHFASNMVYLWVFGDNIEDRFGHVGYVVFYITAGIFASVCHLLTDLASQNPTVGASGAIAGVLGAYFVFYPNSRINTLVFTFFITVIQIKALWLLGFWMLLQFFQTAIGSSGVAYWAHIGGFIFGVLIAYLLKNFKIKFRSKS
tara:strand:- start:13446 stop:14153 length:708 start_codon:yes stop_codon:yes gene_type:complete